MRVSQFHDVAPVVSWPTLRRHYLVLPGSLFIQNLGSGWWIASEEAQPIVMPSTWFNLDPNSWDVFFCSYFLWLLSPPIGIGLGISFLGHSTCCSSAKPGGFWAFILWCAAAGMFLAPEQPDGSGIPFHHWICMVSWNQQLPNDPLKCIGSLGNLTVHNNTPLLLVCSKKVSFFEWKNKIFRFAQRSSQRQIRVN